MGCICVSTPSGGPLLLLNNLTSLKSTSLTYAKAYRKYGERYHKLPLHIRGHGIVPPSWQGYCKKAFVVSGNDELPDLIQVFDMLEKGFEAARSCVFKGEVSKAKRQLYIAAGLAEEAEDRVAKLRYAVEQYEWLLELHGSVDECAAEIQSKNEREKQAWKMALPKCCGAS